jgi:methyl-accepting chemotaxis protein
MSNFRQSKFILSCLLALVLLASVLVLDNRYRARHEAEIADKFQLLGELRRSALESYFKTAEAEISFWSVSPEIRSDYAALSDGWDALGGSAAIRVRDLYISDYPFAGTGLSELRDAGDGSEYSYAHAQLHALASEFVTGRGYYDLFLIDLDGNIIYTVEKEQDYATNLARGAYSRSGLGDVFRRVTAAEHEHTVVFSDFARYAPSNGEPAIFAGKLMFDAEGKRLGVLALQLPSDKISDIMHFKTGMGESGETYLVGPDLLMRSNSRFSDISTVLDTTVDTETVQLALSGERGVAYTQDYRGIEVLSAYDYIDIEGLRWAVMAEIDADEIAAKVGSIMGALTAAAAALFGLVLLTFGALRDFGALDLGSGEAAGSDYDSDAM